MFTVHDIIGRCAPFQREEDDLEGWERPGHRIELLKPISQILAPAMEIRWEFSVESIKEDVGYRNLIYRAKERAVGAGIREKPKRSRNRTRYGQSEHRTLVTD